MVGKYFFLLENLNMLIWYYEEYITKVVISTIYDFHYEIMISSF